MDVNYIKLMAKYEAIQFRRGWIFKLFTLIVVGINVSQLFIQGNFVRNEWYWMALPSSFPYFLALCFNIVQVLFVIFAVHEVLNREKRDTEASLLVRPISNVERSLGQVLGIAKVVFLTCLISMVFSMLVNLFASDSPFSLGIYVFYFVTLVLPGFVLAVGMAMLFLVWGKNRVMVSLVLILVCGVVGLYLYDIGNGFFDFTTRTLTKMFSDVTGHVNLWCYLLQRLAWFLGGIGLLFLAIGFSNRLPNRFRSVKNTRMGGMVCIVLWACLGVLYFLPHVCEVDVRKEYIRTFERYIGEPTGDLESLSLVFRQSGDYFTGDCELMLKNMRGERMDRLLLFLNPGLVVKRVVVRGQEVSFVRDRQVLTVDMPLDVEDSVKLRVVYAGKIDGRICYLDIPDEEYYRTSGDIGFFRLGKQNVFLEEKQTLLIPECLWYPVTCSPVNPVIPWDTRKNFTHYTLSVVGETDRTVISQGIQTRHGDTLRFTNEERLTGITFCAGDYEKKSVMVDSVLYSLYYFRGHDFFSEDFDDPDFDVVETLKTSGDFFRKNGMGYFFKRLTLVETALPFASYFRKQKGGSDRVQPELLLLPEYAVTMVSSNFKKAIKAGMDLKNVLWRWTGGNFQHPLLSFRRTSFKPGEMQLSEDFSEMEEVENPLYVFPLSTYYVRNVRSEKYPLMDIFFSTFFNSPWESLEDRISYQIFNQYVEMSALDYFLSRTLEDAARDRNLSLELLEQMVKLKCTYLRKRITMQVPEEKFKRFLEQVASFSRFRELSLDDFEMMFRDSLGVDFEPFLREIYMVKGLPVFEVRDAKMRKIETDEYSGFQISCKVLNSGKTDGIFSFGGLLGYMPKEEVLKDYYLPAGKAMEIWLPCDKKPLYVGYCTNISGNRPMDILVNCNVENEIIMECTGGEREIDSMYFRKLDGEIVVDNQDPGFSLVDAASRNKIYAFFHGDKEKEKYRKPISAPGTWRLVYNKVFYGEPECTAYYKICGTGESKAIWRANLPENGLYEVFVANRSDYAASSIFAFITGVHSLPLVYQYYTLYHAGGVEEIRQKMDPRRNVEWLSLGRFRFNEGEAKLELLDKGVEGQRVFADAVKWVRVKE